MKKRLFLMIAAIFIICVAIGCGGKNDSSAASPAVNNSQITKQESSVDMKKLDETMAITDALLKSTFGSDYSLVYDQGGVTISIWKEYAAKNVDLAKSGNREAADSWGKLIEYMQEASTKMQEILGQYGISGIPVTFQCFDTDDKSSALGIVVDGKVTYDASK